MSGEMMREADADERWDDDADDDETKVAVWGNNRQKRWRWKKRSLRWLPAEKWLWFPLCSKSCHLATSCLFSTSHRPEGDKQPCCLIGNRCCEWDREKERDRDAVEGVWAGKKWIDREMLEKVGAFCISGLMRSEWMLLASGQPSVKQWHRRCWTSAKTFWSGYSFPNKLGTSVLSSLITQRFWNGVRLKELQSAPSFHQVISLHMFNVHILCLWMIASSLAKLGKFHLL